MPVATFDLTFQSCRRVGSLLYIELTRDDVDVFHYIPGQFITFLIDTESGIKRRSYSIANLRENHNRIEIVLTHIPGGLASEIFCHAKPGDKIKAMGPVGRLIMKDEPALRYILIGTGTGIAPYRAMLDQLDERSTSSNFEVIILQGVQYRKDLLYVDDFLAYAKSNSKITFRAQYSKQADQGLESFEYLGYVQTALDELKLNPSSDVVYLCGNPAMIDQTFEQLKSMGFELPQIRREKYISSS